MTDASKRDPASLEEAAPDADRGQGVQQRLRQAAIDEAAAQGVNLNSDRDEGKATTAGSGLRESD